MSTDLLWECECGHVKYQHFDETASCDTCGCERFLLPAQIPRDVLIPSRDFREASA